MVVYGKEKGHDETQTYSDCQPLEAVRPSPDEIRLDQVGLGEERSVHRL